MTRKVVQDRRFAAGLCKNCGKREHKKDCTWCVRCLSMKQLTQMDRQKERKDRGLCFTCGRRKPAAGRATCQKCLNRNAANMRRVRTNGRRHRGDEHTQTEVRGAQAAASHPAPPRPAGPRQVLDGQQ